MLHRLLIVGMKCVVAGALAIGVLECSLQIASLLIAHRATPWPQGVRVRVLGVGDSHMYGVEVAPEESFPAHLQRLLDAHEPGRYGVVNLGVPGMNTALVRERLPMLVDEYTPDIVVVWAGINNRWNNAGRGAASGLSPEPRVPLLERTRLYRLFRVWREHGRLDTELGRTRTDGVHQSDTPSERGGAHGWVLQHGGRADRIDIHPGENPLPWPEMGELALADFRHMAEWLRARDVRMVLVTYPWPKGGFKSVNDAIIQVGTEQDVPVVDSPEALGRVPKDKVEMLWGAHPNGPIYFEIARSAAEIIVRDTAGTAPAPATQ